MGQRRSIRTPPDAAGSPYHSARSIRTVAEAPLDRLGDGRPPYQVRVEQPGAETALQRDGGVYVAAHESVDHPSGITNALTSRRA